MLNNSYVKLKFLSLIFFGLILSSIDIFSLDNNFGLKIIRSNTSELILEYTPVLNGFNEIITQDGQHTFLPQIQGTFIEQAKSGTPSKIVFAKNITVPGKDNFIIDNIEIQRTQQIDKLMAPNAKIVKTDGLPDAAYLIDNSLYSNYSTDWVSLKYSGIARNRHIAQLSISAARYNSQSKQIEIPIKIIIKIGFTPSSSNSNFTTNDFDLPISINHNETKSWQIDNKSSILGKKTPEQLKVLSLGEWAKIAILSEGIYKIDASQLTSIGISIPKELVSTIKIFGNGGKELSEKVSDALKNSMNEQEIIVTTNQNGDLDNIKFYASPAYGFEFNGKDFNHYVNHYCDTNYYFLTYGGDPGKRAVPLETPQGEVKNSPLTYIERIFKQEELTIASAGGSGRRWFGASMPTRLFNNSLPNLDPTRKIFYRFSVAHRTPKDADYIISESGNQIISIPMDAVTGDYQDGFIKEGTAEIQASKLSSNNQSALFFDYQSPLGVGGTPFFNYYEIQYPRSLASLNNQISMFSDPLMDGITEYSINGFQGTNITGFETTNLSAPKLLNNISSTGGLFIFRSLLEKNNPKKFFVSSDFKNPSIEKITFGNLRTNLGNSEEIVITHPEFLESANKYKEYRSKQSNISVIVVNVYDIYNEFGSGVPDPTAIRDFIAFAYANWQVKPKYVLLWGDGHYNYKYIGLDATKFPNYLPPYESIEYSEALDALYSYTSDDYFARIAGDDDLTDIAIGRITIDSDVIGQWMVDKINHYENSSSNDLWRSSVTLVADDSWAGNGNSPDGNTHTDQSERLSKNYVPIDIQQKKIYLPQYPTENVPGGRRKPKVTEDLLSAVNIDGDLILNWIGHGNPRVWAHEEILERSQTIPKMLNLDKLFFLTAATCDYGRFDMPDIRSGAEEMLLSKTGGSIGSFASARIVISGDNAAINQQLWTNLFTRNPETGKFPTLGEAMYETKQSPSGYSQNGEKFHLLADPTLCLLTPTYQVRIDTINGISLADIKDSVIILKGLETIKLSASILPGISNNADTSFNGTAIVTMLDGDEEIFIPDINCTHDIIQHGGALNRSSYKVENGRFYAEFIIPKDISYSEGNGRLYTYAYTPDNRFAKGATTSYKIQGVKITDIQDKAGPAIKIFLDSRDFKEYDVVSEKPLLIVDLADESGINTTGRGIGHRLEAWFDDNPQSVNLTDNFKTSLENSRQGSAEKIIYGLLPGNHTVKVRGWDIYNNFSEAETSFIIADENSIVISDLINIPNPFSDITKFRFVYNVTPPFTSEIKIYSMTGNLIRTLGGTVSSLHSAEIDWDGLDENNREIAQGPYIYVLSITGANGNFKTAVGKLCFIKE
jgi:hypothetical protein